MNNIRNDLTVEPVKFGVSYGKKKEDANLAFKVFRETDDYLILPKYFGLQKFGKAEENIDFMPTILSRFDTIFIIKVRNVSILF